MHFEQRRERDNAASGGIDASKTVDLHGGKKVRAESGEGTFGKCTLYHKCRVMKKKVLVQVVRYWTAVSDPFL